MPNGTEDRHDIIQAVEFRHAGGTGCFLRRHSVCRPVDSYVTPEPWAMPGYDSDVIMAAGAFIQGSSIELSADGPLKPPYAAYFQGGLTWEHAKLGILRSAAALWRRALFLWRNYEKNNRDRRRSLRYACRDHCGAAGASVTLLEGMEKPGKKLLITGSGRCNLYQSAAGEHMLPRSGRRICRERS